MSEEVTEDAAAAEDPNAPGDAPPPMDDDVDDGATQVVGADDSAAAVEDSAAAGEPSPFDEPPPEEAAPPAEEPSPFGDEPSPFDAPAEAPAEAPPAADEPSPFDEPPPEEPAAEAAAPTPDPEPVVEQPAAEDKPKKKKKRKKIDLKSRLKGVRASGSMAAKPGVAANVDRKSDPFPPPPGGVPAPRIKSISSPLVASPFAPPEEKKKPTAEAQTIKVEMGEEVQQERKRASKKAGLYVVITAIVVGGLGFFLGRTAERSTLGNKAVEGAAALATDVKTANDKMSELSDALRKATEKLSVDEYPTELADVLKNTNIPFSAQNFQGKGVGGLPPEVFNQLLKYTKGVAELNDKKDQLRNVLSRAQKPIEKYFEEKEKPRMKFSVLFAKKKDKGITAEFVQIKEPFLEKEDWPEEFTILQKGEKGKPKETKVKLLKDEKAKLVGTDDKWAAPMQRESVPDIGERQIMFQLRKALNDTKELVDGNQSPVPSQQTDGLVKEGSRIIEALTKISNAG